MPSLNDWRFTADWAKESERRAAARRHADFLARLSREQEERENKEAHERFDASNRRPLQNVRGEQETPKSAKVTAALPRASAIHLIYVNEITLNRAEYQYGQLRSVLQRARGYQMAIYQSMQRVRFSSEDGYKKFLVLFADVRRHLKPLPGFLHLTWWVHPDDPTWFNEVSFWTSKEALEDWHMSIYHKHAKAWAARGAIMEDVITNFELKNTRLLRVCPCCGHVQDKTFDLAREREILAEPCPNCQFHFPVMPETTNSTAVFKDAAEVPEPVKEAAE